MKNLYLFLVLVFPLISHAQDHPTCDGSRYTDDVYSDIDSTMNILYGEGVTIAGNTLELYMDIYEPSQDIEEDRPVIILAFGGSFIAGEKEDIAWLCKRYTRKGYVAATIDYRLYDLPLFPLPSANDMQVVVTKAVGDFKGAIRYIRSAADNGNPYGIDPDHVYIGGISAGGIAAMHAAVLDTTDTFTQDLTDIIAAEGGLEGTVNDYNYSSEVQGVINFSGGLNDAQWIDANDPPFISVHDNGDPTVPYAGGFANIFGFDIIYLEGSKVLEEVADSLDVLNYLKTYDRDSHVSYLFDEDDITDMVDLTASYIHDLICEEKLFVSTNSVNKTLPVKIYPNHTSGEITIDIESINSIKLDIYNTLGSLVYRSKSNNDKLDLSFLNNGVYYLTLDNYETQSRYFQKIIIKK